MLPLRRVLLADDDLEVRRGVEELLAPLGQEFSGLEFLHAESGLEALTIARARFDQLHLMVLDMHMPGCSGLDVLTSLRGELQPFRVPCIFYSGEATSAIEHRAFEAGAWAFLRKPVQPEQLRGEVLRALQQVRP
jgi:CheY-like chemotaxis protein